MQSDNGRSLDERQLVDAAARTAEQPNRRRRSGRRGDRCGSRGRPLLCRKGRRRAAFAACRMPLELRQLLLLVAAWAEALGAWGRTTHQQQTAACQSTTHALSFARGARWGTPLLTLLSGANASPPAAWQTTAAHICSRSTGAAARVSNCICAHTTSLMCACDAHAYMVCCCCVASVRWAAV
jgi:hypothetical protein